MHQMRVRSSRLAPELAVYRNAVNELIAEITDRPADVVEKILIGRLVEPEFSAVVAETAIERLIDELTAYMPNARSSAVSLPALARIFLLSQIDASWWGGQAPYETDTQLCAAPELVDLAVLRKHGALRFRYRKQPTTLAGRVWRAAERRAFPLRTPRTAGLLRTVARPEAVALLNQVAVAFARKSDVPLWATSLTRSVEHQHHLRSLGYSAMLPSAHCVGYALDIEMTWLRRQGAGEVLEAALFERQALGDINVIDEGQAWHLCINPAAAEELRQDYANEMG